MVKKKRVGKIKKLDPKVVQRDIDSTGVHVIADLHAVKFGLAGGIVWAIVVMGLTIAGIYGYFLEFNALIISIYGFLGYAISVTGVLIGAVCGFVDGFIGFWLLAVIYNKLI